MTTTAKTTHSGTVMPTDYIAGYDDAYARDPELTDRYVEHAWIGDPLADAMTDALAELPHEEANRITTAAMNEEYDQIKDAPKEVFEFFESYKDTPAWLDKSKFTPGYRLFHRNSTTVLASMLGGVLIEGFSTNIAQSFFITGRLREMGIRRLKQNNRQLIEIFLPGGLDRQGDGWKLSVRLRLVHSRARRLLAKSDEWDYDSWGVPLCSAHMGFAVTAFSARCVDHAKTLGASFTKEEETGFIDTWRYAAWLMGIPDSILYTDKENALHLWRLGAIIEPPPDIACIAMANSLISCAPIVLGIEDSTGRKDLASYMFSMSRALIGNELADQLRFDQSRRLGKISFFRAQIRYNRIMGKLFPNRLIKNNAMAGLFDVAHYQDDLAYHLPDTVHAEHSSNW